MKASQIKTFIRDTLKLKTVRVTTGKSKHPYIRAWLPYKPNPNPHICEKDEVFPDKFRIHCLHVIYGEKFVISQTENVHAGNVDSNGIAMHEVEWLKAIQTWVN